MREEIAMTIQIPLNVAGLPYSTRRMIVVAKEESR
jgi:hypothetical protein